MCVHVYVYLKFLFMYTFTGCVECVGCGWIVVMLDILNVIGSMP